MVVVVLALRARCGFGVVPVWCQCWLSVGVGAACVGLVWVVWCWRASWLGVLVWVVVVAWVVGLVLVCCGLMACWCVRVWCVCCIVCVVHGVWCVVACRVLCE